MTNFNVRIITYRRNKFQKLNDEPVAPSTLYSFQYGVITKCVVCRGADAQGSGSQINDYNEKARYLNEPCLGRNLSVWPLRREELTR